MEEGVQITWRDVLEKECSKPYYEPLVKFVRGEYAQGRCYPLGKKIFEAFALCPFDKVKVVILGQDPYHGEGQADGLCFSVSKGVACPPSLRNIFTEVSLDMNVPIPSDGSLVRWAQQGVLLLNATLTVRAHQAGSHAGHGWEEFTDSAVRAVSLYRKHVVFMLWGISARRKISLIDSSKHLILQSVHPSPLSANRGGWFGNHHFSRANAWLLSKKESAIKW